MKEPNHKSGAERVEREAGLDQAERLDMLRELFPEAFAEGKVDWDKLRATLGEEVSDSPERYSFTWAGKRDAIRLLQMPSRATLVPAPDESVNWDTTKNAFIEGDNLEVLKLLLKPYYGRVKMIYIDPPYNTGNDFVYPDNYSDPLDTYLKLSGQKDSNGNVLTSNAESSGRFHSSWLSMMYPRLFLARQLLRNDGIIFISIDDNESANLKMLMNEIFGENAFVADIPVVNNLKGRSDKKHIATAHERFLIYKQADFEEEGFALADSTIADYKYEDGGGKYRLLGLRKRGGADTRKERPKLYFPIYVDPIKGSVHLEPGDGLIPIYPRKSDGVDGRWRWAASTVLSKLDLIEAVEKDGVWTINSKDYLKRADADRRAKPKSVWFGTDYSTDVATKQYKQLMENIEFKNPKPVQFIRQLVEYATSEGDLILDFFAGSGTTGQAVVEQSIEDGRRRNYILVQLPEPLEVPIQSNGRNVATIADITKERLRRVSKLHNVALSGKASKLTSVGGFKAYRLVESNYKSWLGVEDADPEQLSQQLEAFADPLVEGWKHEGVIYEVAIKNGFGLNLEIDRLEDVKSNEVFRVSDPDKGQSFLITLDAKLDPQTIKGLELSKDDLFICRDSALTDEQAANLALQCRLKTV